MISLRGSVSVSEALVHPNFRLYPSAMDMPTGAPEGTDPTNDPKFAKKIVSGLHKFRAGGALHVLFKGVLEEAEVEVANAWFEHYRSAEICTQSQSVCEAGAQPAIEESKTVVGQSFKHTCAWPDTDGIEAWSTFEKKEDWASAHATLRSTPGNKVIVLQLEFIDKLSSLMQITCKIGLARMKAPKRQDRNISEDAVKNLTLLRVCLRNVHQFKVHKKVIALGGIDALFKNGATDVAAMLQQTYQQDAKLNVKFSVDELNPALQNAERLAIDVIADWVADANDVVDLINGWMIPGWEAAQNGILTAEHRQILVAIMKIQDYKRIGKAGILLNSWRNLMKQINQDGCGTAISAEVMGSWSAAIGATQNFCDLCFSISQITKEIPSIVNFRRREDKAKQFEKDMIQKRFRLGDSRSKRLRGIIDGAQMEDLMLDDLEAPWPPSSLSEAAADKKPAAKKPRNETTD